MMFFVVSCRVTLSISRELGAKKKTVEGQEHGQKGLIVTVLSEVAVWLQP
jgi:hypothetical protein